jgi:hypothetical protein
MTESQCAAPVELQTPDQVCPLNLLGRDYMYAQIRRGTISVKLLRT